MKDDLEEKRVSVRSLSLTERNHIAKNVIEMMKGGNIEIHAKMKYTNDMLAMKSFGFLMKMWVNHARQCFQMEIDGRPGQMVRREPGDSDVMKEIHRFLYEHELIDINGLFTFETKQRMTCIKIEV